MIDSYLAPPFDNGLFRLLINLAGLFRLFLNLDGLFRLFLNLAVF